MAEKTITLTEAFRVVLRARYPQRPALADEIQSIHYFRYAPRDKSTGRRLDPEAQAADEALDVLNNAIDSRSIRLRAWLDDNPPDDIEPMEITLNALHVFDCTMEVYGERGRTLRTYRNVNCYAADIEALIGASPAPAPRPGRMTAKLAIDFVRNYLSAELSPTIGGLRNRARDDGIVGGREFYEPEYRKQMRERGHVVRPGRRRNREARTS